ncbi:MAG: hypothetical protein CM15mP46_4870 [Alphaproteobacteria bacterium]|nr:MAG: hypothetical protein CM15mP46_4870 [Alphaproteobacteria bacterium]
MAALAHLQVGGRVNAELIVAMDMVHLCAMCWMLWPDLLAKAGHTRCAAAGVTRLFWLLITIANRTWLETAI